MGTLKIVTGAHRAGRTRRCRVVAYFELEFPVLPLAFAFLFSVLSICFFLGSLSISCDGGSWCPAMRVEPHVYIGMENHLASVIYIYWFD